jgi:glycosyltransferase involved in cell wall biosynthesis
MKHRLTVLLPTLNCESYLRAALQCLAEQTFQDFKVLVLDGGSSDDTLNVAQAFDRVPIQVVRCGAVGLGLQLKMGLELADSEYIARLDADDLSLPRRFEQQIGVLDASPDVTILGSQIELLVGDKVCRSGPLPLNHQAIRRILLTGFPAFCHPSVMFRREAAMRCSAYRIASVGEDLDFYLRMTEVGKGANLPEALHQYRLHDKSTSFLSFSEVRKNYRFALACARARRAGHAEPILGEYESRRPAFPRAVQRFLASIECVAARLYRNSRIRMAEGGRLVGFAGASLSLLLRPKLIGTRVLIQLDTWRGAIPQ